MYTRAKMQAPVGAKARGKVVPTLLCLPPNTSVHLRLSLNIVASSVRASPISWWSGSFLELPPLTRL